MNKAQRAAWVLGLVAAAAWPVRVGSALADDAHHDAAVADDHGHAPAKAPAPAKAQADHGDHGTPAKASGKAVRVTPATDKPTERASDKQGDKPSDKPAAKAPDAHTPKAAPKAGASKPSTHEASSDTMDADEALRLLREGNERWAAGTPNSPNTDSARRARVADQGQKPFVSVLTCADSRVPVERVFDRGVGELFTVRVAGNVAGASETGTIEYGVDHLKTPLLVIMGHTKCGAVAAAATGAKVHGRVAELIEAIKPAVDRARKNNPGAEGQDVVPASVRENVWQSIFDLIKGSAEVRTKITAGELKIVGAVYDIASGKVDFMGEHPWQAELVEAMNARAAARSETADAGEASH